MLKASKSAGSNSNANRSQASNINKQTTPRTTTTKRIQQILDRDIRNTSTTYCHGRRQIAAPLNKNDIFLLHLGFVEQ